MAPYNDVQTIGNAILGGSPGGCRSVGYHVLIEVRVIRPDNVPNPMGIETEVIGERVNEKRRSENDAIFLFGWEQRRDAQMRCMKEYTLNRNSFSYYRTASHFLYGKMKIC
jgi:hypothetical protein